MIINFKLRRNAKSAAHIPLLNLKPLFALTIISATLIIFSPNFYVYAALQNQSAKNNNSGGIVKGKVRNTDNKSVGGASVTARQGERDIAQTETDAKGDFVLANLPAGTYNIVIRKTGLRVGTISNLEVKTGKTVDLRGKELNLPTDEASLAILRGSVFTEAGRSVRGAQIEIARLNDDGSASKRFDARLSDATGQFAFRLSPDAARYRVTVKIDGAATQTQDVAVEGAVIYRIAFKLQPKTASIN